MSTDAPGGEILVYEAEDGGVRVDVRLDRDTVWLSQEQMGRLFGRERSVITKHLRNAFAEGELSEEGNVQYLHIAGSDKPVRFHSLDVIISVGYRVKSAQGTRFRQWATTTLREHLARGYTLNRQRLEQNARELETALALVRKAASGEALTTDQGRGLVDIIARYTQTFLLLQRYDKGPAVFCDQASPLLRWEQAHRLVLVRRILASQRASGAPGRAGHQRCGAGGAGATGGRIVAKGQGSDDPPCDEYAGRHRGMRK
jgi:hypothetical protein